MLITSFQQNLRLIPPLSLVKYTLFCFNAFICKRILFNFLIIYPDMVKISSKKVVFIVFAIVLYLFTSCRTCNCPAYSEVIPATELQVGNG